MAAIDSDLEKIVVSKILADATIVAFLAKDKNNKPSIRPSGFNPNGPLFPQITYSFNSGKSEPIFPATKGRLHIIIWADPIETLTPKSMMQPIVNRILAIFNRKGSSLNLIDVATDTGVRITQILKEDSIMDYDEVIKKNFAQVIFDVNMSEGESFDPSNAGDKAWQ